MSSNRGKIVFDLLLTAVLLFEVLHQLTGNTPHEIVGAAFFACIVVHLVFSRRWIVKATTALKAHEVAKKQRRLMIVASLLAADVLVLLFSSIVISQTLWGFGVNLSALNPGNIWYPIHTVSAYALCILVLGHLSMHWRSVADALSVPYDPSRREAISSALNGVVMIGGIALGLVGFTRAGFQASDFSVNAEGESESTVTSGYREVNAQTGEYTTASYKAAAVTDSDGTESDDALAASDADEPHCPLCPRQCKLSSPRCGRPYEAGLIERT